MKLVMFQDCISPHQVPLARELVATLGEDSFRYVYRDLAQSNRVGMGWAMVGDAPWFLHIGTAQAEAKSLIENADCLLTMFRDVELFKRRHARGQKTFVQTERWFKPRVGILRMLSSSYRRMAREFVRLMDEGSVVYLPMGIHAARDMARLCGLMHGDLRCLFRAPRLEFERKPGGRIFSRVEHVERVGKYCLDKMRMWGYFVESSKVKVKSEKLKEGLRVLWVGRLLKLKRVDTIIRAVGELSRAHTPTQQLTTTNNNPLTTTLDIYGTGPEEARLKKFAAKYGDVIKFYPSVSIGEVRKMMQEHNVYVFGSNGYEGWGAVVNEALEEGMRVFGTYEAGSSATVLPKERLFHNGDYKTLSVLLGKECKGELPPCSIGDWTAAKAAECLSEFC